MPIFGNGISIIVGSSGSSPTTASYQALNFLYTDPSYGPGIGSSSLGSISFTNVGTSSLGATGVFQINLPSENGNADSAGNAALTLLTTGSSSTPLLGIGLSPNTLPIGTLDIRSTTGSEPANLILRTNEDGVIEEGETTGRIIFAIESSSYNVGGAINLLRSGSTSEIFSRVKNADEFNSGVYGSLVVQVNDADSKTVPLDILELGYGVSSFNSSLPAAKLSGSLDIESYSPYVWLTDLSGSTVAYLGYDTPIDFNKGQLLLYNSGSVNVNLTAGSNGYYSGSNFGFGTKSPTRGIVDISGSLFVSNAITASNISASNNIDIGNRIGPAGDTYIDFNLAGSDDDIAIYNSGSITATFTSNNDISASGGILTSASLGGGTETVLMYDTGSGRLFFTGSTNVGASATPFTLQQVTDQSPFTTHAITASAFSASGEIYTNNLIVADNITGSTISASGNLYVSEITSSAISSSGDLYSNNVTVANHITASSITASQFFTQNGLNVALSSSAGIVYGQGGANVKINGDTITFGGPISGSSTLELKTNILSGSFVISGSGTVFPETFRMYSGNDIFLSQLGGQLNFGYNGSRINFRYEESTPASFSSHISASGLAYASASVLETGSLVPSHNGEEGEMKLVDLGGSGTWIYVYIAGSWKRVQVS
jgi:hypothetical protein